MRGIGVVIQGPVLSRGFDSTTTIEKTIRAYLKNPVVQQIIVSTWVGEKFALRHPKVHVIVNEAPSGRDVLNRRRQWISTLAGVQLLAKNASISHVLKVRTDQFVPSTALRFMEKFYQPHHQRGTIFREPMLFCLVNRSIPFHIGDFYFAGQLDDVRDFLESNLRFGSHIFQTAPEVDSVLKHALVHDDHFPLSLWQRYAPIATAVKQSRRDARWQYWDKLYRDDMSCFPRAVFAGVEWRGVSWVEHVNERLQFNRGQEIVDRYYDFFAEWQLLRSDAAQYHHLPIDPKISGTVRKKEWLSALRNAGEWLAWYHRY